MRPFLRWAGGKQQLVDRLIDALPTDVQTRTYREPFLGAGSLFFALCPPRSVVSDSNEHLIKCYVQVRNQPETVARLLRAHARKSNEAYYYEVRRAYNAAKSDSAAQAARFIYLNRSCFNGIFRVNKHGDFNVPYGRKEPPPIPSQEHLRRASGVLAGADARAFDYRVALEEAVGGDFVYLDPPYPPLSDTAYFTHYTADRFDWQNQAELAAAVKSISERGCLFMMTNAYTDEIRRLYQQFDVRSLEVTRFITCKKHRHRVSEALITNYAAPEAGGQP